MTSVLDPSGASEFITLTKGADGLWRSPNHRVFKQLHSDPLSYIELLEYKPKFLEYKKFITEIWYCDDRIWRDQNGGMYALVDSAYGFDGDNRAGIGIFSVPNIQAFKHLNDIGAVHDFMYTSPGYQMFHTRKDADDWLQLQIKVEAKNPLISRVFGFIVKILGRFWWDNKKTNTEKVYEKKIKDDYEI